MSSDKNSTTPAGSFWQKTINNFTDQHNQRIMEQELQISKLEAELIDIQNRRSLKEANLKLKKAEIKEMMRLQKEMFKDALDLVAPKQKRDNNE